VGNGTTEMREVDEARETERHHNGGGATLVSSYAATELSVFVLGRDDAQALLPPREACARVVSQLNR
jgi:hypothetical protein